MTLPAPVIARQNWTQSEWDACRHGERMLSEIAFLSGGPDDPRRKPLVLCATEIARLALPYAEGDLAGQTIETVERWARNQGATKKDVGQAIGHVRSVIAGKWAGGLDGTAAWSALYAASEAANTVFFGNEVSVYAPHINDIAMCIHLTVTSTAQAIEITDGNNPAARDLALGACADIVRKHYPKPPMPPPGAKS